MKAVAFTTELTIRSHPDIMYSLSEFTPYTEESKVRSGEHLVLAWSQKTGYYFTQFGFCVDVKIIAIKKESEQ